MAGRSKLLWAAVAVAVVAAVALFVAMFQPGRVPHRAGPTPSPLETYGQKVDQLLADGIVTKAEGHSIWVEAGLWKIRTEQSKVEIASACGTYAGLKDGTAASCQVRDNRTGKVLAEWFAASGLKAVP